MDREGGCHSLIVIVEGKCVAVEESTAAISADTWPKTGHWFLMASALRMPLTLNGNERV